MCASKKKPVTAATLRVAAASSVEEIIAMETEYSLADLARPREQRHGGGAVSRLVAVAYSVKYPSELNARFAGVDLMEKARLFPRDIIFANRDKNGLAALITPPLSANASASEKRAWNPGSPIALQEYYGNYQVALVLGGIGAAYRLTSHLRYGNAVIFEDYHFEVWYARFLVPGVHYIPLARCVCCSRLSRLSFLLYELVLYVQYLNLLVLTPHTSWHSACVARDSPAADSPVCPFCCSSCMFKLLVFSVRFFFVV